MSDRTFRVVVVGAGISGLFMVEKLKQAGIEYTVYEKSDGIGGTWRTNTFPGLYVDVLSRQYEFPFRPNYDWSRMYAPAHEIQEYIETVARERNLTEKIRFNEEIVSATFTDGRWHLKTAKGESDVCDVFVCATGFLHKPMWPDIEGRESFAGRWFHSSQWDNSIPLKGKRWGVIGGGASGIQITEALAWAGADVTQFIRRAQWVHIRPNPYTTWRERIFLRLPGGYRYRQKKLWEFINKMDRWRLEPGPAREAMEREFKSYLDIIRDPELKRKLTPDYPLGCTRIPKSDKNYYEAVQLPNVKIVKGSIAKIVPSGLVMEDGTPHDVDVLVYATGFDVHAYMRPMTVTGLNGVTVDEIWKDNIFSYRGVALPGFPNMFLLYGPFSPVNNIPVPMGLDQEIGFVMRLIEEARAKRVAIAPTAAATKSFLETMRNAMPGTVWFGGCRNWYSDQQGIPILWPFPQEEHRVMLNEVKAEELEYLPASDA